MEIAKLVSSPSVEKPWQKKYKIELLNEDIQHINMYDYLYEENKNNLSYIALNYYGRIISYKELIKIIKLCANSFKNLNIKEKDEVGILLPVIPEFIYSVYALNVLGAVPNIIEPSLSKEQIIEVLNNKKPNVIIILDILYNKIKDYLSKTSFTKVIVVSLSDSMPNKMLKANYHIYDDKFINWINFIKLSKENDEIKESIYYRNNTSLIFNINQNDELKTFMYSNDLLNTKAKEYKVSFDNNANSKCLIELDKKSLPIAFSYLHVFLCLHKQIILEPIKKLSVRKLLKHNPKILVTNKNSLIPMINQNIITKIYPLKTLILSVSENSSETIKEARKLLIENIIVNYTSNELLISTYNKNTYNTCSLGIPLYKTIIGIFDPITCVEKSYDKLGEICIATNNKILYSKNFKKHSDGKIWHHTKKIGYISKKGNIYLLDEM